MQDMVIKGTGNSRFLKSVENFLDLFPTYEAFAAAFASGILPVDFNGINPDGITQMGTPFAKSAVLQDETAALFGLDETATPNDAFFETITKLNPLCERYTIEKIVDVTLTEATETFYNELPRTLASYPILIFRSFDLIAAASNQKCSMYAVENTESTETLLKVAELGAGAPNSNGVNMAELVVMPQVNEQAATAKYLYCKSMYKLSAGGHFEIWGAVK